mmetsp:Transcript_1984/g.4285  ORF Transcript_1984/g.4285 Transcript_1984/m.4285 type:complete len:286 (-) Transcript_1984:66-923(-)
MHIIHINGMNLNPPILRDMVQIVNTSTHGITMTRMINGTFAQINRLLQSQIRLVIRVQHTVGIRRTGPNREVLSMKTRAIIIDIIQLRSRLIPPSDHGSHTQSISTVRTHRVGKQLRRGRYRNTFFIPQLVHAALHSQITFPERTIGGSSRHGSQKEGIDFNHLFDGSGGDVGTHGGTGVDTDDDAAVPFECEGGGTLGEFDRLGLVAVTAGGGKVIAAKVCGISHVGHFELSRLTKSEAGDHGAASDGPLIVLAVIFLRPDIENIVADGERGSEHDDRVVSIQR